MQRHDLLHVDTLTWRDMLDEHPHLQSFPLVNNWASSGWPVIVRRPTTIERANAVSAALPLPPRQGKCRLGFSLHLGRGVTARAPILLQDAARSAPTAWQPIIEALLVLGDELGSTPRVFGALLWEHLTGLAYLTDCSDLDLLWEISSGPVADRLLAALCRLDAESPFRIDGELLIPGGCGVSWREMAMSVKREDGEVLVKSMDGVATRPLVSLFNMAPAS